MQWLLLPSLSHSTRGTFPSSPELMHWHPVVLHRALRKTLGFSKCLDKTKTKNQKCHPDPGGFSSAVMREFPNNMELGPVFWTGALNRALLPNPCSLLCFKCHVQKVETPPIMLIIYATDLLFSFIKGDVHTLVSSNARAYCSIQVFC